MMASTKHIEDLPREMFLKILSYVSIKDLFSVQHVCTHWKEVSLDNLVWKYRVYSPEYDQSDTEIASLLEQTPKLQTLILTERIVGSDLIEAVTRHCPNLKKLMFHDSQELSVRFLNSLVEKCPNIESFNVPVLPLLETNQEKMEWRLKIIGRFSHLKELCFAGCGVRICHLNLVPIADGCPSLQSVDLSCFMYTHDDLLYLLRKRGNQLHTLGVKWYCIDLSDLSMRCSIPPISGWCAVLKSLYLHHYPGFIRLEIPVMFRAIRTFSSITRLTLGGLYDANIDDVVSVFENHGMKHLVELRFTDYFNYKDRLANIIVNNCQRLKLLYLEYCMGLCVQSVENFHLLPELESISLRGSDLKNCELSLSKCINLKYLNLENCSGLRQSSLELITDYSNLEVLILDGCSIKGLPMHLFSTSLTRLVLLSIKNCSDVNEEALVQLKAERPCLLVHDQNIMGCDPEEGISNTEPEGEVQPIQDEGQGEDNQPMVD